MNSTEDSNTTDASQHLDGFAVSVGVSIGVLVLILIIVIAVYLYRRKHIPADTSHQSTLSSDDQDSITIELGLNEATVQSYPKLLYFQAKLQKGDSIASCCSICLMDYKDNDILRLIPECDHLFHLKCIDQWLRQQTMCPLCRNTPTPPTETAPMATRREFFIGGTTDAVSVPMLLLDPVRKKQNSIWWAAVLTDQEDKTLGFWVCKHNEIQQQEVNLDQVLKELLLIFKNLHISSMVIFLRGRQSAAWRVMTILAEPYGKSSDKFRKFLKQERGFWISVSTKSQA